MIFRAEKNEEDKEEDVSDQYGQGNLEVGQESLDRLAIALGGTVTMPAAFRYIPDFLGNAQDWRYRMVGLMTISQIGEGVYKEMKKHLQQVSHRHAHNCSSPNDCCERFRELQIVGSMTWLSSSRLHRVVEDSCEGMYRTLQQVCGLCAALCCLFHLSWSKLAICVLKKMQCLMLFYHDDLVVCNLSVRLITTISPTRMSVRFYPVD